MHSGYYVIIALRVLKTFAMKHIHDIWRKNLRWRRKEEFLVFPASYLVVVPENASSVTVACFDSPLNALFGSKKSVRSLLIPLFPLGRALGRRSWCAWPIHSGMCKA